MIRIIFLIFSIFISSCARLDKPSNAPVSFVLTSQGYTLRQSQYLSQLIKSLSSGKDSIEVFEVISKQIFSFSSEKREIILSTELLKSLPSEGALAFILCHEISHIERDHFSESPSKEHELFADRDAILCMYRAGYEVMEAKKSLFSQHIQNTDSHPENNMRWAHCLDVIIKLPSGFQGIIDTKEGMIFRNSL